MAYDLVKCVTRLLAKNQLLSRKPMRSHTLEATQNTSNEVKTTGPSATSETVHKLGYAPPQYKRHKKDARQRFQPRERNGQKNTHFPRQGNKWNSERNKLTCIGCGSTHSRDKCKFREAVYHNCQKKGHIAKVCKSKQDQVTIETTGQFAIDAQPAERVDVVHNLNQIIVINRLDPTSKRILTVQIEGRELKMELDSGAPFGIVSKETLHSIKPTCKQQKTNKRFVSYLGHSIKCIGYVPVNVTMGKTSRNVNLYVMESKYDSLFGNEWISAFVNEIPFRQLFSAADGVHAITTEAPSLLEEQKCRLNYFLANHEDLFNLTPGKLSGPHLKKILQILETGQCLTRFGYKAPEVKYTLSRDCLLLEHGVVIPPSLRPAILADLHAVHIGIVRMNGLARSFVFWPGIDADIENIARTCAECGRHAHAPPKYREHWEYFKVPWE